MKLITATTIFLMTMSLPKNATEFAYNVEMTNENVTSQLVYKKSADGRYLSHHLKYNFAYDEQERLVRKEVLKWNAALGNWERSYCLDYSYDAYGYSVEYVMWNAEKETYAYAVAKQVYDESLEGSVTLAWYRKDRSSGEWVVENRTVMLKPDATLLAAQEADIINSL